MPSLLHSPPGDGARARHPFLPGRKLPGVHVLRTIEDVVAIRTGVWRIRRSWCAISWGHRRRNDRRKEPVVVTETKARAVLDRPGWSYIDKLALDDFRAEDWRIMAAQRRSFYADHQARHVLALMALEKDDTTFGYCINNYEHGLQTATMVLRAGHDEETVVAA